jgi:ribosomal protein L40E
MELIRDIIEWIGNEPVPTLATLFPYLVVGLLGLYMLWLLVGYLRVSQVGVADAHAAQPAIALPGPSAEGELPAAPRGVPYCAFDGLQYPAGARFCTACERDLSLDCVNCGATLTAGAASCFRCGTRTGADPALLG